MVVPEGLSHFTSPLRNSAHIRRHNTKRRTNSWRQWTPQWPSVRLSTSIRLERFINATNTSLNVEALFESRCSTLSVSMLSPPPPTSPPPRIIFGAYIAYRRSSIRASAGPLSKSEIEVHVCFALLASRKTFDGVSTNSCPLWDVPQKRVRVAHTQLRIWFRKYNGPLWVAWRNVPPAQCASFSKQLFVSSDPRTSKLCVNKVNSDCR